MISADLVSTMIFAKEVNLYHRKEAFSGHVYAHPDDWTTKSAVSQSRVRTINGNAIFVFITVKIFIS